MAIAPWIAPAVLAEYVHNAGIRLRRQFRGHTRHPGDAPSIIRACIEACWNGRTFTASPGHFDMFWTRDLSFSVPSLLRLGHGRSRPRLAGLRARDLDEAPAPHHHDHPLLRSAGRRLRIRRRLAAAVPGGVAGRGRRRPRRATSRPGCEAEIAHYYEMVVDPATGLVRSDRKFSAHRDTVMNRSNAYGNTMVALLAKTIEETGWFVSPFERHFRGRLRTPAAPAFLGRRPLPRRARRRDRLGRGQRLAVLRRDHRRPGDRGAGARVPRRATASAIRIRCATRRAGGPSAKSG